MSRQKILICGTTGFIGRNVLERLLGDSAYELYGSYRHIPPTLAHQRAPIEFLRADLLNREDVERVVRGKDIVIQAAATTSGANVIVTQPYLHVTDNAVMNALIFRACHETHVRHVVYFSCTTMYPPQPAPCREEDFHGQISDKYFGVGWTKVYNEKMCEFYSRIGPTRYTAIRHSNIYGPHDKFDLDKGHAFGATVAKVMNARDGRVVVWGDGSEERDLLYVEDLANFVALIVEKQEKPFELVNVGSGKAIRVHDLVGKIIEASGRDLKIEFDTSKPTIPLNIRINIDRVKALYHWAPETPLEEGIRKTLAWYRTHHLREKANA